MLLDLFRDKKCFKLICGAGNEDIREIEKLVYLYSKAGCNFFDICAKESVIDAAKRGLERAGIKEDRYLCISIGSESDQHFCKAEINKNNCLKCDKCKNVCLQKAIKNYEIDKIKCIGCKKCINICPNNSIDLIQKKVDFKEILPSLINKGIDCIEFHIAGDESDIYSRWNEINSLFDGPLSISINRSKIGDETIIQMIKTLIATRKPYTTIIQADGVPMSGGKDNYNSTLQAVAMADMVKGKNLSVYVMSSGGTNSKTLELARLCDVSLDGVAIGSFARKIVKEYIDRDDFWENEEIFTEALNIAKDLVNSTK